MLTKKESYDLYILHKKINEGKADKKEKLRYVELLYKDNRITPKEYDNYRQQIEKENSDIDWNILLGIGGLALALFLLLKAFKR